MLKDSLSKNTLGEAITLTVDTDFVAPSNGYFIIGQTYHSGTSTNGYVNGVRLLTLATSAGNVAGNPEIALFVRKGMILKFTHSGEGSGTSSGSFRALI